MLLKAFYELGRIPRKYDMMAKNGYPSYDVYRKYFGSWNKALIAAGLKPNRCTNYTKEFLIQELHRFVEENGRIPTMFEMRLDAGYPSYSTYKRYFASWEEALICAGLTTYDYKTYTDSFLIQELLRFVEENNRIPKYSDMCSANGYPGGKTYVVRFGSWNNALTIAGLKINLKDTYTKDELILAMKNAHMEFGRPPLASEMCPANGYPSYKAYANAYGSFTNALKACGFTPNRTSDHTDYICSKCGTTHTCKWYYTENHEIICDTCETRIWRESNPKKYKTISHKHNCKRRTFGFEPINSNAKHLQGHHLWLENTSDFVIFLPNFLHKLYYHSSNIPESLMTTNAIALDYWVNEDFYKMLYGITPQEDAPIDPVA